ncbi:manganese efflux pump MntP family protein [Orbus sturtevantii]|uniref:manganese efflux pump MntP n=1 Tax=Orbus sturtevantii TaxID=3074109 RepID=UPI00370DB020
MNFWTILLLAFAMSTDAFAVAICKGTSLNVYRFTDALKVGVLFGIIEAITPAIGWLLGYIAVQYIEQWDHWIIFVLMLCLGARMIYNSFKKEECVADSQQNGSRIMLILTAISTSIDAFAVGVGLAFAAVNIAYAASMIGLVTCIMVTIGILLGAKIGCIIGKKAELLGGLVLIAIGVSTLYQHLVV